VIFAASKSKKAEKAALAAHAAEIAKVQEKKAAATVKAKAAPKAPKAKAEPKPRRVSAMWVIRSTLAANLDATVDRISKACSDAGVPNSDATIGPIMSDFKQTYQALLEAGRIKTAH